MKSIYISFISFILLIWSGFPARAAHFPWDQGHDTFDWNDVGETGTGSSSLANRCNNSLGSSVFLSTGHFIWVDADVVLKGRPRMEIIRIYNSHDPRSGLFGNGWSFAYDKGLFKVSETDENGMQQLYYVLRMPDGKRYVFDIAGDGAVLPPPGRFEEIIPQADGTEKLIRRDGGVETYAYGRLLTTSDTGGNVLTVSYNDDGLPVRVSDSGGRYLDLAYAAGGYIGTVTDHAGRTWRYNYDADGNLLGVTDPQDGYIGYEYAAFQAVGDGHTYYHLTRVTDPAGIVLTNVTYDGARVESYSMGENVYTYRHDVQNRTLTKTDALGHSWQFVYNAQGLIDKKTDPLGNTVAFDYDTNGMIIGIQDALGKAWFAAYDSLGRMETRTTPLGQIYAYEYGGDNHRPAKIVSPTGRLTEILYDNHRNPVRVTDPAGAVTTFEHNDHGDIVALVDALNKRRQIAYNGIGLPVRIDGPLDRTWTVTYDAVGNPVVIQNAENEETQIHYDALDRIVAVTDPMGRVSTRSYDAAGRLLRITDPAGATTRFNYDTFGRLAGRIAPDDRTIRYQYRTDNRLARITRPDGTVVTCDYDAGGRLTSMNADGNVTTYDYTARGELRQARNAAGTVTLDYDDAGRLVREVMNGRTLQWAYNAEDEIIRRTSPGMDTTGTYDMAGRLAEIKSADDIYSFTYDILGRRTGLTLPNGGTVNYTYDDADRLIGLRHAGAFDADYQYRYDKADRIVYWGGDGADWQYQYDKTGRLTGAGHGADTYAYQYDPAGNILNGGRQYDTANRLVQDDQYVYTYDPAGNLTQKQDARTGARTVYTWNALYQLISVARYADADVRDPEETLAFAYGPLGRRWQKTANGRRENYVYDRNNLAAVVGSENTVEKAFVFGPHIDEPLGMIYTGGRLYYHANHQGSIMALTDASGALAAAYSYLPFGRTIADDDSMNNAFRYTGREYDAEDLYYYRARYYDPTVQRFLSEDPIGFTGGSLNLYSYVQNNPIHFIDPEGLEVRLYSSDAFGVKGLNHAFIWSTEAQRGKGTNGSSWHTLGNGVGDLSAPYNVVQLPGRMTEEQFMDACESAPGWNNWIWLPWINDCHTDARNAIESTGATYPGAPNGRLDIDDNARSSIRGILSEGYGRLTRGIGLR